MAASEFIGGFRTFSTGEQSVANYVWDTGSLSWVVQTQSGGAGGGLTDAELRATPVPVSLTSTTITGSVAVTGTFFQATQPISAVSLPLPTGAATEATLATRLAEATYTTRHPVVGQALMAASMPVVIASNQSAVPVTLTSTTITGSVAVTGTFFQATQPVSIAATVATLETRPGTSTKSNVAAAAVDTLLLASNANRRGSTIFNDSSVILYISLGTAAASTSSYTLQCAGLGFYEVPFSYTGEIRGIWASATGNARVCEIT